MNLFEHIISATDYIPVFKICDDLKECQDMMISEITDLGANLITLARKLANMSNDEFNDWLSEQNLKSMVKNFDER